jgi:hypothetical protein
MEDTLGEAVTAPAEVAKEKVPKASLRKLLAGRTDPIRVIDRIMQQTVTVT